MMILSDYIKRFCNLYRVNNKTQKYIINNTNTRGFHDFIEASFCIPLFLLIEIEIEIEIEIIFTYLLLKLCAVRYTFFHLRMI